jgi:hypothetical protein
MISYDVRNVDCWYCVGKGLHVVVDENRNLWARCALCGTAYTLRSRADDIVAELQCRPCKHTDLHLIRRPRGRTAPPKPVDLSDLARKRRKNAQDSQGGRSLFETVTDPSEGI